MEPQRRTLQRPFAGVAVRFHEFHDLAVVLLGTTAGHELGDGGLQPAKVVLGQPLVRPLQNGGLNARGGVHNEPPEPGIGDVQRLAERSVPDNARVVHGEARVDLSDVKTPVFHVQDHNDLRPRLEQGAEGLHVHVRRRHPEGVARLVHEEHSSIFGHLPEELLRRRQVPRRAEELDQVGPTHVVFLQRVGPTRRHGDHRVAGVAEQPQCIAGSAEPTSRDKYIVGREADAGVHGEIFGHGPAQGRVASGGSGVLLRLPELQKLNELRRGGKVQTRNTELDAGERHVRAVPPGGRLEERPLRTERGGGQGPGGVGDAQLRRHCLFPMLARRVRARLVFGFWKKPGTRSSGFIRTISTR